MENNNEYQMEEQAMEEMELEEICAVNCMTCDIN